MYQQALLMYFKSRIYSSLPIVFSFIVISSFLFSCVEVEAIFASIESEEKIKTGNLNNNITVNGMARMGNLYLISTGVRMFHRKIDSDSWDTTVLPNEYKKVLMLTQETPNTVAYFVTYKENDKKTIVDRVLYKMNPTSTSYTLTFMRNLDNVQNIILLNGVLYATERNADGKYYTIYANYETASPTKIADWDDILHDMAFFKNTVYLISRGGLFSLAGTTITQVDIVDTKSKSPLTSFINGIYSYTDSATSQETLVLSNKGYIWATSDGTTWTRSTQESNTVYTDFIFINQSKFTGLLVGTRYFIQIGRDKGYQELPDGKINTRRKPSGNKYTSGTLNTAAVLGFFLDEDTLFVRTKKQGLWRGNYTSSIKIDWFQE